MSGEHEGSRWASRHSRNGHGKHGGTDWETSFKREFLELSESNTDPSLRWTSGARSPPLVMSSPTQIDPLSPKADELLLSPPQSVSGHQHILPETHKDHAHHHHHTPHQHQHVVPIPREPHMQLTATRAGSGDSGFEEVLPLSSSASLLKHGHVNAPPLSTSYLSSSEGRTLSNDNSLATTHLVPGLPANRSVASSSNANKGVTTIGKGTRLKSGSGNAQVKLVRALGEGAFSSVWLAIDEGGNLTPSNVHYSRHLQSTERQTSAALSSSLGLDIGVEINSKEPTNNTEDVSPVTLRRKSSSWAKKSRDRRMQGITPPANVSMPGFDWNHTGSQNIGGDDVLLDELVGEGASASGTGQEESNIGTDSASRFVAVKVMNRALCDANDRTRISFVREVEVLRHISHPSIVSYLHSFTSEEYNCHCLVLEHIPGGELFSLVNSDSQFKFVTEKSVRRMWGELARAVGWMHGVGLVHRDIKLENILLTRNIFAEAASQYPRRKLTKNRKDSLSGQKAILPPAHIPLVKLTDFGLSRFIDPENPLLSTRCGSESYAAPELVLGSMSSSTDPSRKDNGYYDGRQTDAWACGVVLYALATRQLPFDVPPPFHACSLAPSRTGSVRSTRSTKSNKASDKGERNGALDLVNGMGSLKMRTAIKRRDVLMRIAQCEYYWPDEFDEDGSEVNSDTESAVAVEDEELDTVSSLEDEEEEEEGEMPAQAARRIASPGLKRIVRRLLERNPDRRARMVDLWDEPWMRGEGAVAPPASKLRTRRSTLASENSTEGNEALAIEDGEAEEEEEVNEDGMLLDEEHIDSVASQELEPL